MGLDETLKQIQDAGVWKSNTVTPVNLTSITDENLNELIEQLDDEKERRQSKEISGEVIGQVRDKWDAFTAKLTVAVEIKIEVPVNLFFESDTDGYTVVELAGSEARSLNLDNLKTHPIVIEHAVRFQKELDELNAYVAELAEKHNITVMDIWEEI